jgi:hypothetical protein
MRKEKREETTEDENKTHTILLLIARSRNPGSIPGKVNGFISSPKRPDWLCDPSSLLHNGYRVLSQGVKRPGRIADHPTAHCGEAKNEWS